MEVFKTKVPISWVGSSIDIFGVVFLLDSF